MLLHINLDKECPYFFVDLTLTNVNSLYLFVKMASSNIRYGEGVTQEIGMVNNFLVKSQCKKKKIVSMFKYCEIRMYLFSYWRTLRNSMSPFRYHFFFYPKLESCLYRG